MAKPLKARIHELESLVANPRHELHVDCLLVCLNFTQHLLSRSIVGTSSSVTSSETTSRVMFYQGHYGSFRFSLFNYGRSEFHLTTIAHYSIISSAMNCFSDSRGANI